MINIYLLCQRISKLHLLQKFFLFVAESRVLRRRSPLDSENTGFTRYEVILLKYCKIERHFYKENQLIYRVHHIGNV